MASTGPIPIISGEQPETEVLSILARGFKPCSDANSSEQTRTNAAPSVSGDAVPAVTVPLASNASRSPARPSALVSGLMHPSASTVPSMVSIGMISPDRFPDSLADDARDWLSIANSS